MQLTVCFIQVMAHNGRLFVAEAAAAARHSFEKIVFTSTSESKLRLDAAMTPPKGLAVTISDPLALSHCEHCARVTYTLR